VNARNGREYPIDLKCKARRLAPVVNNIGIVVCKDHVNVVDLASGDTIMDIEERIQDIKATSLTNDRVVIYGDGKFRLVSVYDWSTLRTLTPKHEVRGDWAVSSDGRLLAAEEYFQRQQPPRRRRGLFLYSIEDESSLGRLR
jgi:hypothetical protein